MKAYKLLTKDMTSHGECKWEVGKWKKVSGKGELCSPGWLHFYSHPLLAMLLNPIHANLDNPVLWEAEVRGKTKDDHGLKVGWTEGRIIKKLSLPKITITQRIKFGILSALEVYKEPSFIAWADDWLSGKDRTRAAERAAERAAWAAVRAEGAMAEAAVWAAEATERATAEAAEARAAAMAAEAKPINLIAIAKQACKIDAVFAHRREAKSLLGVPPRIPKESK